MGDHHPIAPPPAAPPPRADLFLRIARALAPRPVQLGWFVLLALATRVAAWGDPNLFADELFYLQLGLRQHAGLLPYVDLWDRKGPGLFALYGLIAALPVPLIGYQVVATGFVVATAWAIQQLGERLGSRTGATWGATFYIVMLPLFGGIGGQAPVFYNLFIALAAMRVLRGQLVTAMLLAGLAASFKQTALAEGLFLGLWGLWQLRREDARRLIRLTLAMAAAGAAPLVLPGLGFAAIGHFAEFWYAMVTSNLVRTTNPGGDAAARATALAWIGLPLLLPAAAGLIWPRERGVAPGFVAGWVIAALVGLVLVPNFLLHYMLPLLLPLSLAAAAALDRPRAGTSYALAALLLVLLISPSFWFAPRQQSRAQMAALAAMVQRREPHPRLLVFLGPSYLYEMVGRYPPTPLFFPYLLGAASEDGTSWRDAAGEMRRVLAWQPQVVVVPAGLTPAMGNPRTVPLVLAYLRGCQRWGVETVSDFTASGQVIVYGDCKAGRSGGSPSGGGPATGR
ncbi:hypothetical protein ACFOON_15640 [Novosphingobium piscinae]|uniref:Glycosyltransferase RgtA/B/C/D-like domain-containing protein n=1 Tax=Novosphingobium piscinae TaxID=1507448 RepID=A0A7X1KPG3_9SPHN|nr:hypothetical protein [Novosphingobium piscinae]MBC2668667.1 hypothetical protein [Novosphingobium piscinae]